MSRAYTGFSPFHAQRGVALLMVLWVVMLLTVIALGFAHSTRIGIQASSNSLEMARLRAHADGGVQRGIFELLKPMADGERWLAEGREYVFQVDEVTIRVVMRDESARIDINAAPDMLLKSLLLAADLAEYAAAALIDAILDWRDPDDLARALGAEREHYEAEGRPRLPANAPFQEVEELLYVRGMTPALFKSIAPALTVHSRLVGINSRVAERQVLLALPNVIGEDVDAHLAARQDRLAQGLSPLPFPAAQAFEAGGASNAYNIRVVASSPSGLGYTSEASVRIARNPRVPFEVLQWREGRMTRSLAQPH